jgi:hypothetical protein
LFIHEGTSFSASQVDHFITIQTNCYLTKPNSQTQIIIIITTYFT